MREIFLLCGRLEARSQSAAHCVRSPLREDGASGEDPSDKDVSARDSSYRDLRLAAAALRAMTRSFHVSDVLTIEE
jgi:hypothetical protein